MMRDRVLHSAALTRLSAQLCRAVQIQQGKGKVAVPEAGQFLWGAFLSLSEARSFHRFGPNPIGFSDISAWGALMGVPLAKHHVGILRAMDSAWIDAFYARQASAPTGVKTLAPVSKQPLTAALFDIAVQ